MRAPKCYILDFQLTKEPQVYRKNENSPEYILLCARSYEPQRNGAYFNALFQCYGDIKNRVERMKLRQGSVVDIIAEMTQYQKGESYETAYRVIDITFSETPKKETKTEQTQQKEVPFIDKMNALFMPTN